MKEEGKKAEGEREVVVVVDDSDEDEDDGTSQVSSEILPPFLSFLLPPAPIHAPSPSAPWSLHHEERSG